ncbi:hypothetical protein BW723_09385 [Polaribacter reichenbachii]|uniref:NRDE family protein n=1 Tax=Polaribacter reichenbachii TaxID=996801 RepID=A0A1B8U7C5_9FLAO|nr:NRDE family protein [Polaribacter reichenbachii]APZ46496.1 hypothetical protein BW723_09385 [Polaribacter reichenbachii]AUC20361.1 hypothetical protein BTO17_17420 [Polaribacter reichenbachii]OBY67737.1 hypothetical protein LPB301_00115 [Polaribacter reichenbachii]
MCTVTYLPLGDNNFILTSNRDETPLRETIQPKTYLENGVEITYPKDELAGGTWIGTSNKNRLVCLLNGGFENHKRQLPYKMSRGVLVKNILSADDAIAYIDNFDFINIEPFTLIFVDWNTTLKTYELVWDGLKKHFNKLPQEPKIWSSSTLYTFNMRQSRKGWFANWLAQNKLFTQESILQFHNNSTLGNVETSIKMKREFVETVSITSILKTDNDVTFNYFDFIKAKV